MRDYEAELAGAVDQVLAVLFAADEAGVALDPLACIVDRMRARGEELDLDSMPPLMQMLLSGMT